MSFSKRALWHCTLVGVGLVPLYTIAAARALARPRQTFEAFAQQRSATVLARGANPDDIKAASGCFWDAHSVTGQLIFTDEGQHLGWRTADVNGAN